MFSDQRRTAAIKKKKPNKLSSEIISTGSKQNLSEQFMIPEEKELGFGFL